MTEIADFNLLEGVRPTDPSILLDAGPPRALYKVNPRLIKGQAWWDTRRKQAYKAFGGRCGACGRNGVKLEAHELYDINKRTGKCTLKDVVSLCFLCHSFVHQDLHDALIKKGELKFSEVQQILEYGKRVLRLAGLSIKQRKDPNNSKIKFEDWRMVIDGIEYSPVFNNTERK